MSEAFLQSLLSSLPAGVLVLSSSGKIIYGNPSASEMLGRTGVELAGLGFEQLVGRADRAAVLHLSASRQGSEPGITCRVSTLAGDARTVQVRACPFDDASGNECVLVFLTDAAGALQLPVKTVPADELAETLSHFSHEFNNILTAVMVNLSIALMDLDRDDAKYSVLMEAQDACLQGRDLTQRLLSAARKSLPVKYSGTTPDIIRDTVDFTLRGSSVKPQVEVRGELRPVRLGPVELTQVLHCIVQNLNATMPSGGRLSVVARNCRIGSRSPVQLKHGDYVEVHFRDNGMGIPDEESGPPVETVDNDTIEEFTLPALRTWILDRGGDLAIKSKLAAGTVVKLYLPVATAPDAAVAAPVTRAAPGTHTAKVLVMDDEPLILSSLQKMLTSLGYLVEIAEEGEKALALYSAALQANEGFDVVFLDLTLPGGKGAKTVIKALRKIDPHVQAIITTGYSGEPILKDYRRFGFVGALAKPFQLSEVTALIRKILSKPEA